MSVEWMEISSSKFTSQSHHYDQAPREVFRNETAKCYPEGLPADQGLPVWDTKPFLSEPIPDALSELKEVQTWARAGALDYFQLSLKFLPKSALNSMI